MGETNADTESAPPSPTTQIEKEVEDAIHQRAAEAIERNTAPVNVVPIEEA